ncbi:hypothetical protein [Paenibacillus sp. FSL H3-0286]|uniref:hypothetical protein n=1 Tax=Paenibacillus sp. FSL H3-0286 TaxID=2921427 RepID=UPI003255CAEC
MLYTSKTHNVSVLYHAYCNYYEPLINKKVNITAKVNGIAHSFNLPFSLITDTNIRIARIIWEDQEDYLPYEFWEPSIFPIHFEYDDGKDTLEISGNYKGHTDYLVTIKLPNKDS